MTLKVFPVVGPCPLKKLLVVLGKWIAEDFHYTVESSRIPQTQIALRLVFADKII